MGAQNQGPIHIGPENEMTLPYIIVNEGPIPDFCVKEDHDPYQDLNQ